MREEQAIEALEIVVVDTTDEVDKSVSVPWNIFYEERPQRSAFLDDRQTDEHWEPFWAIRYNLACSRRVDPLKRLPVMTAANMLMIIDPEVYRGLEPEQRRRLDEFAAVHQLPITSSLADLEQRIANERPKLMDWLCHATPNALRLGEDDIKPVDLLNLLQGMGDPDNPATALAFLNACQTAEPGRTGSFVEALYRSGLSGVIATEQQTIDSFANEFGLDFLEGFLDRGEPVGKLLQRLRRRVPLGLLYGAYCPPDIRVARRSPETIRLGSDTENVPAKRANPSPLPSHPYRSLSHYDRADRDLFVGRDLDVNRFSLMLDHASTRILVLHGESGVGKSSFLRGRYPLPRG